MVVAVLTVALGGYNNLLNLWRPFHGYAYIPTNLFFVGAVALIAKSAFDLGLRDVELGPSASGAGVGLAFAVPVVLGMFALAGSRWREKIVDRRVADLSGGMLAYQTLVRIPLGTAFVEELLFRGVYFAVLRDVGLSTVAAAVASSAVFGVWHISPTVVQQRINRSDAPAASVRRAVVIAVVFTTAAGLLFVWLRVWTGDLAAPIVLHACINSGATLASVVADRRTERSSPIQV